MRPLTRRSKFFLAVSLGSALALVGGCVTLQDPFPSSLTSEETLRKRFIQGMLGRLERARATGQKAPIDVCVEQSSAIEPPEAFVLEVQLAYAGWLKAAGLYDETSWNRLNFYLADHCTSRRDRPAAFVVVYDPKRHRSPRLDLTRLVPPVMSVEDLGSGKRFRTVRRIPGGIGGTSVAREKTYTRTRKKREQKRRELRYMTPAPLFLNPHFRWVTTDRVIKRSPGLSRKTRAELVRRYRHLLSHRRARNLDRLGGFAAELARHDVRLPFGAAIENEMKSLDLAEKQKRVQIHPQASLLMILYHEVGHQLGFQHTSHKSSVLYPDMGDRAALFPRDRSLIRQVSRSLRRYFARYYVPWED